MSGNQPNTYPELLYRVGTFFLLVGTGLVILFVLSESARQTVFGYFCWGMILLMFGFIFRARYRRAAPPSSGRFSIFQRLKRKPKEDKAKK
jgi:uncharacterized membrane protein YccC